MVANEREGKSERLPEHLYGLRDGEWGLWRWVVLRGAGFAVREVLGLAATAAAAAADRLTAAETAAAEAQQAAINQLKQELREADGQARRQLNKVFERVRREQTSAETGQISEAAQVAVSQYEQARLEVERLRQECRQAYEQGAGKATRRLQEVAAGERFREAVIWQNRRALHTGLDYLLRQPADSLQSSKTRRQEELVANYLQRYCTKNDTIGFFNPVGWARLVDQGGLIARPGPSLVTQRQVYFEGWCIDALCSVIAGVQGLQPWIAPRRVCFIDLEGTLLHMPSRAPVRVSAAVAAVLAACDGRRSAKAIAQALLSEPGLGIENEEKVYEMLRQLEQKNLVVWTLESTPEAFPERSLRRRLEGIDDAAVKASALAPLDELEAARDRVAAAAGNAERLDQALGELESVFTRITGTEPTRDDGETYAARTLIYEDCRRDIDMQVGPEVLKNLEAPLSLLLTSARWFSYRVALAYRQSLEEVYGQLVQRAGTDVIDFATFWYRVQTLFFTKPYRLIEKVKAEFQKRWASILTCPPDQKEVRFETEELQPKVSTIFDAPQSGWSLARYHSPDVMIAACGPEAIRAGNYRLVIGEIHLGSNTQLASLFVNQHPSPEDLRTAVDRDFSEPKVLFVVPKSHETGQTLRLLPELARPGDIHLKVAPEPPLDSQINAIPIGALVVERTRQGLSVRTRDRRFQADLLEVFGEILSRLVDGGFRIMQPAAHIPRVCIDNLVVWRESWSLPVAELSFAFIKDKAERFRATRNWARKVGAPRFVFIRSPLETKPFYVDFDSPIYVDIYAKGIRRLAKVGTPQSLMHMSEMLPSIEQTWLSDRESNYYTSEFRMVCLDRKTKRSRSRNPQ